MAKTGFDYYLSREALEGYKKKSLKLRLEWLFYGNILRKNYPKEIIEKQERLRGKLMHLDKSEVANCFNQYKI